LQPRKIKKKKGKGAGRLDLQQGLRGTICGEKQRRKKEQEEEKVKKNGSSLRSAETKKAVQYVRRRRLFSAEIRFKGGSHHSSPKRGKKDLEKIVKGVWIKSPRWRGAPSLVREGGKA